MTRTSRPLNRIAHALASTLRSASSRWIRVAIALAFVYSLIAPIIGTPAPVAINPIPQQIASAQICPQPVALVNTSFESPVLPGANGTRPSGWTNFGNNIWAMPESAITGWFTTATDNMIEIWGQPNLGVPAYDGNQFAELNANQASTLYQDIDTSTLQGFTLTYGFAHRGRDGTDTMSLRIGSTTSQTSVRSVSTGNTAWVYYTGTYTVPVGQTTTRFAFRSDSTANGNNTVGNFLDAITFGTPPCSTDLQVTKTANVSTYNYGTAITYTITIRNVNAITGQFDVTGATLSDPIPAAIGAYTWTCTASTGSSCITASGSGTAGSTLSRTYNILAQGTVTYTVTGAITSTTTTNLPASIANTATVALPATSGNVSITDSDPTNNTSTNTITLGTPQLTVVKTSNAPTQPVVGTVITYTYTVTNTGGSTIRNVTLADPMSGLSAISPSTAANIAPGANRVFTATRTVTQADINAGSLSNTGTASGTSATGAAYTSNGSLTVPIPQNPTLTIVKSSTQPSPLVLGSVINYSFLVTNTGNVTMTNVQVIDTLTGLGTISPASVTLAPGASQTFTASKTVTQADVNAGGVNNSATARGTLPNSTTYNSQPSTRSLPITRSPSISIVKSSTYTGPLVQGQTITYSFLVTNTGNVTLNNVNVTDPLSGMSAMSPTSTTLAPGGTQTFTATKVITAAEVLAGQITNTATAHGTPTGMTEVTSTSTLVLPPTLTPSLAITKTSNATNPMTAGTVVTYTYTVTNTGNVNIKNVTVTDGMTNLSAMSPTSVANLIPGASTTFTATYTVTQSDINNGSISNSARANGTTPGGVAVQSPIANYTFTITRTSTLTIDKTSTYTAPLKAGDTVTYGFRVTNTGNVTLTNVSVSDLLSGLSAISPASVGTLAPGASANFSATYIAKQSDVDAGRIQNTATGRGTNPQGTQITNTDTETISITRNPAISVVKTSNATSPVVKDQVITFSMVVTNTGNVTLTNVTVADNLAGISATTPASVASLAPGA